MLSADTEPQYPIRIVARRTGLSPHVLRAWERRYGAVEPARSGGGGRLYSNADIIRFGLLERLTREGHAISRIAGLPTAELAAMAPEPGQSEPARPLAAAAAFVASALASVREMDGPRLYGTLMRGVVTLPSAEFRNGVVLPLLRLAGDLWERGDICPAHEHVLSTELSRVLGWVAATVPVPAGAPQALAVTPSGHRHEFGAMLASVVAAEEGWQVIYLGADLPAADIAVALRVRRATVVMLSVVREESVERLGAELRALRDAVGKAPAILVGGRGVAALREPVEEAGASWVADLEALGEHLRALHPRERA